jgi:ribokinase
MGRIVVLGSLNTDLVTMVPHLPRPGETVLGGDLRTFPGGKGANQAVAAARLGGQVAMVGRVGKDAFGAALIEGLAADGVDTQGITADPALRTGAALILVDERGQNQIAVAPGANRAVGPQEVSTALEMLGPGDMLLVQQEIPAAAVRDAIRGTRSAVLLNAAPPLPLEPELLQRLDVLVVNETEAEALFGRPVTGPEAALEITGLPRRAGVNLAVVTLGAAGAAFSDGQASELVAAFDVHAVDATAAGDAFVGALAVALVAGTTARGAVRLANAAGAAATTKAGAQSSLPSPSDLKRLFDIDWPAVQPTHARKPRKEARV